MSDPLVGKVPVLQTTIARAAIVLDADTANVSIGIKDSVLAPTGGGIPGGGKKPTSVVPGVDGTLSIVGKSNDRTVIGPDGIRMENVSGKQVCDLALGHFNLGGKGGG